MISIIYNPDGSIKTFAEDVSDLQLLPGETVGELPVTFEEYAARFVLSHNGQPCQTVFARVGDAPVQVQVSAPGFTSVAVDVNGTPQTVELTNGTGTLTLPTDAPGRFALSPTDSTAFCRAGWGSLLVVIQD